MIQVVDANGVPIKGLFKKADGSIVVKDQEALRKSQIQKNAFVALNNEVVDLKQQLKKILEKLNGES